MSAAIPTSQRVQVDLHKMTEARVLSFQRFKKERGRRGE